MAMSRAVAFPRDVLQESGCSKLQALAGDSISNLTNVQIMIFSLGG